MGIKLNKGSHDISLKYTPAGFNIGLAATAVSVVCIALITFIPMMVRKHRKNKAAASVPAETVAETVPESVIEEVPVGDVLGMNEKAGIPAEDAAGPENPEKPEVFEEIDNPEERPGGPENGAGPEADDE